MGDRQGVGRGQWLVRVCLLVAAEGGTAVGAFLLGRFVNVVEGGWASDPVVLGAAYAVVAAATVVIAVLRERSAGQGTPGLDGAGPGASGPVSRSGPAVDASGSSGPVMVAGHDVSVPGVVAGKMHVERLEVRQAPAPAPVPVGGVGQVVVGGVPGEPVAFQERGVVVGAGGRVCALVGGPGVGKSQVAAAWAREQIVEGCAVVAWVNAESRDSLVTGMAVLADRLGVADPQGDSERSAARVCEYLSTADARAAVVFDNATDPEVVRVFTPQGPGMRVVVTSTNRAFERLCPVVDVGVLSRSESVAYLGQRTHLDDGPGAGGVAQELGDLPLALAQAASVIAGQRLGYSQYLERLRRVPVQESLVHRSGEPYPRGTAEAVLLSWQAVTGPQSDPDGWVARVLGVVAVLSATSVSRDILHALGGPQDDLRVDRALEQARDACLVTWAQDPDTPVVVMHRLVARVIREHAHATGSLRDSVERALTGVMAIAPEEDHAWQDRERATHLPDHVKSILDATEPLWTTTTPTNDHLATRVIDACNWAVRHLTATADLTRATHLGTTTTTHAEQLLGPDHPDTLTSRNGLAGALRAAGNLERAIPLYEQTLTDRTRVLGPDHPSTLTSRNNLAGALESAGDLERAIPLYEQTLTDAERVLSVGHPLIDKIRKNLLRAKSKD